MLGHSYIGDRMNRHAVLSVDEGQALPETIRARNRLILQRCLVFVFPVVLLHEGQHHTSFCGPVAFRVSGYVDHAPCRVMSKGGCAHPQAHFCCMFLQFQS